MRFFLEQLVFHDSRCEWVDWARDLLGENSLTELAGDAEYPVSEFEAGPVETIPPPSPSGPELVEPLPGLQNPLE